MKIRDRIVELVRVPASELRPNPRNWRTHSQAQLDALRGILAEIGFAGAALGRRLADGSILLIDGHARTDISGDAPIPVLILDVTAEEADKILATFDPLGAMAGVDAEKLAAILAETNFDNPAINAMLDDLAKQAGILEAEEPEAEEGQLETLAEKYQILIEFDNEQSQTEWLEKLTAEGLQVRSLMV